MTKAANEKLSEQQILETAARLVAQTINCEAMNLKPDEVDLEQFIKLFMKKAAQMLEKKERLLLGIGEYLTEKGKPLTEDMETVIKFIEQETQTRFYFFNGILIYLGKEDIASSWIPDWPL